MIRCLRLSITAFAVALLASCAEYEDETYEIGYKGEARFNPFLAASRLLERFDYSAERSSGISRLPDRLTTIIIPAGSVPSFGSAQRLRRWVEGGGHLIYLVSGYRRQDSDSFSFRETISEANHPLLEEFGIELVAIEQAEAISELRVQSGELMVDLPGDEAISVPSTLATPDVAIAAAEPGKSRLLSMPLSNGRLTVVGNAAPFRNRNIENYDHARLILELVGLHGADSVLFIYGKGTTFMKMLFYYAWMPLLGLGILTLLWIWKNLPRFGPVIPHFDGGSRQFTEHIEMSGRFLWRHHASAALLAPLATQIHRTFQKKYPHIDDSIDAHIDYLVEHTDLPREEISEALLGLPVKDPASMTRVVKNLKLLSEAL